MNLIVFEMPNFDMILRMDFLKINGAKIDYRYKKVQFNLRNKD